MGFQFPLLRASSAFNTSIFPAERTHKHHFLSNVHLHEKNYGEVKDIPQFELFAVEYPIQHSLSPSTYTKLRVFQNAGNLYTLHLFKFTAS